MKKFIKTKTKSGNPTRVHIKKLDNDLLYIDKFVYSNVPLKYFEVVEEFPKRFGRVLYRQELVLNELTLSGAIVEFYSEQFDDLHRKFRR